MKNGISLKDVVIVDMISTRFSKPGKVKGRILCDVDDLSKALSLVIDVAEKEKCDAIILDSLSTMQIYYDERPMLEFAP